MLKPKFIYIDPNSEDKLFYTDPTERASLIYKRVDINSVTDKYPKFDRRSATNHNVVMGDRLKNCSLTSSDGDVYYLTLSTDSDHIHCFPLRGGSYMTDLSNQLRYFSGSLLR